MTLQVIGAGYGRTGTLSMRVALSKLLGGPCYHMASIVEDPTQLDHWHQWAKQPGGSPDWERILDGYVAAVDAPICFFVEELMQRYPDAKVVLTLRDPDRWVESFKSLMSVNIRSSWLGLFSGRVRRFGKFGRTMGNRYIGSLKREDLLQAFHAHNEHIRKVVPSSKLLEMRVQDGWQPLCEFLQQPVPNEPFPHANEGVETIKRGHWRMATSRGMISVH